MIHRLLNREGRKEDSGQRDELQQGGDADGEGKVVQITAIRKWREQQRERNLQRKLSSSCEARRLWNPRRQDKSREGGSP